ncbi:unnamed protein product, partial [Laminaria digitata]
IVHRSVRFGSVQFFLFESYINRSLVAAPARADTPGTLTVRQVYTGRCTGRFFTLCGFAGRVLSQSRRLELDSFFSTERPAAAVETVEYTLFTRRTDHDLDA